MNGGDDSVSHDDLVEWFLDVPALWDGEKDLGTEEQDHPKHREEPCGLDGEL